MKPWKCPCKTCPRCGYVKGRGFPGHPEDGLAECPRCHHEGWATGGPGDWRCARDETELEEFRRLDGEDPDESIRPRCRLCGKFKPPAEFVKPQYGNPLCLACRFAARWIKMGVKNVPAEMPAHQRCEICGGDGGERGLVLDHCHQSDEFRGWLCGGCNTGLGMFRDDPARLAEAAWYLIRHQERLTPVLGNETIPTNFEFRSASPGGA